MSSSSYHLFVAANEIRHTQESSRHLCVIGVTKSPERQLKAMNTYMPLSYQKYTYAKVFPLTDCHNCIMRFVQYDIQQYQCMDTDEKNWYWLDGEDITRIKQIIQKWTEESFCCCKQRQKKNCDEVVATTKITKKDITDKNLNFAEFCKLHDFDLDDQILTKMWNWTFNKVILSKDVLGWLSIRKLPVKYVNFAQVVDENGTMAMDPHIFEEMIMQLRGPNCRKIQRMFILLKEIIYLYIEYDKNRNE